MRLRTDLVLLERNFSGSTCRAPATMSALASKSRVPWWRIRSPHSRWAVPETLRPSTKISLRPEASACRPKPCSASTTGCVNRAMLKAALSPASVMKE